MSNDRDFIFDNFELEDEEVFSTEIKSVEKENIVSTEVKPVEVTEENDRIFPSVDLDKLTDEQFNKLCSVVNNGINKIIIDLSKVADDDDIPFW